MTYFGARYYISKQTSYKKNAIDKPRLINLITGSVFYVIWDMMTNEDAITYPLKNFGLVLLFIMPKGDSDLLLLLHLQL